MQVIIIAKKIPVLVLKKGEKYSFKGNVALFTTYIYL